MANPFLGEIRMFGFGFAPYNWAVCAGQTLPISQNAALFSLLGTTYGGDGRTTFQLPNLVGQVPINAGSGPGLTPRDPGDQVGSAAVALVPGQLAPHSHSFNVQNADASLASPAGNVLAKGGHASGRDFVPYPTFAAATPGTAMAAAAIIPAGGNQPHSNLQPTLAVNFCIALSGVFPTRP
ncbi:MAG TPA: tail fiber protein [bacterium]|jgi:microcystin-dependent protein|nr:tail fiber protein [bacterium]